jgi:predicted DCC family thiol-disulfide oxidoreductase YuxK
MTLTMARPPVLLFDGDCGFCTKAAGWAHRAAKPNVTVAASNTVDLTDLGLTAEDCAVALQFVDARGDIHSGAAAVAALLESSKGAWPILGRTMRLPVVRKLAAGCYRLVARNRHRLPGATTSCAA